MTPQSSTEQDPPTHIFTARELARLAVYRAAVAARFYNEQCEPASFRRDNGARSRGKRRAA
jgi:hypothetical protein